MNAKYTPGPWSADRTVLRNAKGQSIASGGNNRVVCCEEPAASLRLAAAAPDLLASLERLSFAAECRDNTMGDACRLFEVKAELAAANRQAIAAINKAKSSEISA